MVIFALMLIGCSRKNKENDQIESKDFEIFTGDKIISDKNFVDKINKTCIRNVFNENDTIDTCILSKSKYDENYSSLRDKYKKLDYNKSFYINEGKFKYLIKKCPILNNRSDSESIINIDESIKIMLCVFYDNVAMDSIVVFEDIWQTEFVYSLQKNFYLNKKNLWILNLYIGETGNKVTKYKKYKINSKGKFEEVPI
jgi:hypothetical protein